MKPMRYKKPFTSLWFTENRFIFQDAVDVNVLDNGEMPENEAEQQKSAREKVVSVLDDLKSNDAVQKSINEIIGLGEKDLDRAITRFQNGLKQLAKCWSETNEGQNTLDDEMLRSAVLTEDEADMITFIDNIDDLDDVIRICKKAGFSIPEPQEKKQRGKRGQKERREKGRRVNTDREVEEKLYQPEKLPDWPIRQAILTAGGKNIVLRGVFVRSGNMYKYWKSSELRNRQPNGYRSINVRELQDAPGDVTKMRKPEKISIEPYDGMRVAINEDGREFRGIFELDGTRQYKWWRSEQDRKIDLQLDLTKWNSLLGENEEEYYENIKRLVDGKTFSQVHVKIRKGNILLTLGEDSEVIETVEIPSVLSYKNSTLSQFADQIKEKCHSIANNEIETALEEKIHGYDVYFYVSSNEIRVGYHSDPDLVIPVNIEENIPPLSNIRDWIKNKIIELKFEKLKTIFSQPITMMDVDVRVKDADSLSLWYEGQNVGNVDITGKSLNKEDLLRCVSYKKIDWNKVGNIFSQHLKDENDPLCIQLEKNHLDIQYDDEDDVYEILNMDSSDKKTFIRSKYPDVIKEFITHYEECVGSPLEIWRAYASDKNLGIKLISSRSEKTYNEDEYEYSYWIRVVDPDVSTHINAYISYKSGNGEVLPDEKYNAKEQWKIMKIDIDNFYEHKQFALRRLNQDLPSVLADDNLSDEVKILKIFEINQDVNPYLFGSWNYKEGTKYSKEEFSSLLSDENIHYFENSVVEYPIPIRDALAKVIRSKKDPIFNPSRESIENITGKNVLVPHDEMTIAVPYDMFKKGKVKSIVITIDGKEVILPIEYNRYHHSDYNAVEINTEALDKAGIDDLLNIYSDESSDRIHLQIYKADVSVKIKIGTDELSARCELPKEIGKYTLSQSDNGNVSIQEDGKEVAVIIDQNPKEIYISGFEGEHKGRILGLNRFEDLNTMEFETKIRYAYERNRLCERIENEIGEIGEIIVDTGLPKKAHFSLNGYKVIRDNEIVGIVIISPFKIYNNDGMTEEGITIYYGEGFYEIAKFKTVAELKMHMSKIMLLNMNYYNNAYEFTDDNIQYLEYAEEVNLPENMEGTLSRDSNGKMNFRSYLWKYYDNRAGRYISKVFFDADGAQKDGNRVKLFLGTKEVGSIKLNNDKLLLQVDGLENGRQIALEKH